MGASGCQTWLEGKRRLKPQPASAVLEELNQDLFKRSMDSVAKAWSLPGERPLRAFGIFSVWSFWASPNIGFKRGICSAGFGLKGSNSAFRKVLSDAKVDRKAIDEVGPMCMGRLCTGRILGGAVSAEFPCFAH